MTDSPAPRDRIAAIDSRSPEQIAWANYWPTLRAQNAATEREVFMSGFEACLAAFPVLAAEPTTDEATSQLIEHVESGLHDGHLMTRANYAWDQLKPRLAALAPEPAEPATITVRQALLEANELIEKCLTNPMWQRFQIGIRAAQIGLTLNAAGLFRTAPVVSPDEPKPADPAPYVSRRFGGRRRRPNLEYSICQPRPEFDQDRSHYPKEVN